MAMAVTHATMLNVSVFTYSPIKSRRLTISRMKITTTGSHSTPAPLKSTRMRHPALLGRSGFSNEKLVEISSPPALLAALMTLRRGRNVAVVFDVKKGDPLPQSFYGFKVTDGDLSDLRFLDEPGTVTEVRAKGKAKKDCSGVVQSTLVQIARAA